MARKTMYVCVLNVILGDIRYLGTSESAAASRLDPGCVFAVDPSNPREAEAKARVAVVKAKKAYVLWAQRPEFSSDVWAFMPTMAMAKSA